MKGFIRIFFAILLLGMVGCGNTESDVPKDTFKSGVIHVSCDESFKPVIDAQVNVYEASYPGTKIIVHYKPEADCLRDLFVDSIRMIIATRGFSPAERQLLINSLKIAPEMTKVAHDAIAVIVHPQAADSFFTMDQIRAMLQGNYKGNVIPVLDGLRATSTVRFMMDSVLRGGSLDSSVTAAQSSKEVVDYVSKVPNAIGFVGISWVGNREDTLQRSFLKKVRLARIESTDSVGGYVLPVQYLIYTGSYPMVRDLVYVVKEQHLGLGRAFGNFMESERGQLVFKRAYLYPVLRPFYMRRAELVEED